MLSKLSKVAPAWVTAIEAAQAYLSGQGYRHVNFLPEIVSVSGACEQISTMAKLDNFYGKKAFLAQSGQLYLEAITPMFGKVWTQIMSSRQETSSRSEDLKRRLSHFSLLEIEFITQAQDRTNQPLGELINALMGLVGAMGEAVTGKTQHFGVMYYTEACDHLNVPFGTDFNAQQEQEIVRYAGKPVFVTEFPKKIKFFNMMDTSRDTVYSTDLLMPLSGESTGAAVREVDPNKLIEKLITSDMYRLAVQEGVKDVDFDWYIGLHVANRKPTNLIELYRDEGVRFEPNNVQIHAGAGLGLNRLMQSWLGLDDVREATPFVVNEEELF